jgi:hypothetical protein
VNVELYGGETYESFKIRAARPAGDGSILREEAYLANETELVIGQAVTDDFDLVELAEDDEPIWLFPGEFDTDKTITADDYAELKAKVGVTLTGTSYNTKYDINEYTGIDGGDLASVKSGVGKEVDDNKYNAKTITVNEAD